MTLLRSILAAVGLAAVVAALEVLRWSRPDGIAVANAWFVATGVGALVAVPFGSFVAAVWHALATLARRGGVASLWAAAHDGDPAADRTPVRAWHAAVVGIAVAAGMHLAVAWVVLPALLNIEDAGFARGLGFTLAFLTAISSAIAGVGAALLVRRPLARLDARWPLPRPRSALVRAWLLGLPFAVLVGRYCWREGEDLGTFAVPLWLLVFLVAHLLLVHTWARVVPRRPWIRATGLALLAAAAIISVLAMRLLERAPVSDWASRTPVTRPLVALLRKATDLDRDGHSSWFGGGDCAGFDPSRSPTAVEVPGNGLDEDCDADDLPVREEGERVVWSAALTPEQVRPYNVIVVVVDAVRADHTSVLGYKKETTPYLEEMAKESLLFSRAYSQSSATMLSIPSLLTGRDPSALRWIPAKRLEVAADQTFLSERLAALDYDTALVGVSYVDEFMPRMLDTFATKLIARRPKGEDWPWFTGRAGLLTTEAIGYLEQRREDDDPFFMFVYIPDPHEEYDRHPFGLDAFGKTARGRYDSEIANADRHLGFFVEYLHHRDLWDDTIVVVTADHGEEFGEHGGKEHARTCYEESTHVPLVVHVPGVTPARIDTPVALIDVVPTILEAVGSTDDDAELEGQSLFVPALTPDQLASDRALPCAIISQRAKQGNFFVRALRTASHLLVHERIEDRWEFYDTTADPQEQHNLVLGDAARDDPELERLRALLGETLRGDLAQRLLTD